MMAFAGRMADYLQQRYNFYTDATRITALVDGSSWTSGFMQFSDRCNDGSCGYCGPWQVMDFHCCTGKNCHTLQQEVTINNEKRQVWTGNFKVRQGCNKVVLDISCDSLAWGQDHGGWRCDDPSGGVTGAYCVARRNIALEKCSSLWCNRTMSYCQSPEGACFSVCCSGS